MNILFPDLNDDEIRIISSEKKKLREAARQTHFSSSKVTPPQGSEPPKDLSEDRDAMSWPDNDDFEIWGDEGEEICLCENKNICSESMSIDIDEDMGPHLESVRKDSMINRFSMSMPADNEDVSAPGDKDKTSVPADQDEMPIAQEVHPTYNMPLKKSAAGKIVLYVNKWWLIGLILFIGALAVFFWWEVRRDTVHRSLDFRMEPTESRPPRALGEGYVDIRDTMVNGVPLKIFTPHDATPVLHVGADALNDTTAAFVLEAAFVREDTGGISGAYVVDGNLVSKGNARSGFCAIIDGRIIIGVADNTPYLEQAIETNGYFFRQYPLVVAGQVINNTTPYTALRKALAELDGKTVVVMSEKEQKINDFSQTLVDLGVTNAINLIGSTSLGFAHDAEGRKIVFGQDVENRLENANYLIWR